MNFRKFQKLEKNKEKLKEAYDAADKKDIQLQAEMTQSNTNRKKMKQQLEEERKKLAKLESVPEESRTVCNFYFLYFLFMFSDKFRQLKSVKKRNES